MISIAALKARIAQMCIFDLTEILASYWSCNSTMSMFIQKVLEKYTSTDERQIKGKSESDWKWTQEEAAQENTKILKWSGITL